MVPHMTLSKTLMYHTFYLHTLLCPHTHVVCPHTHDNTLSLSLSVPVSSAKPVSDKNPLPVPPRHYDNLDHHTMFTNNTIYTFFRLFQVKRLLLNLHYICNYTCVYTIAGQILVLTHLLIVLNYTLLLKPLLVRHWWQHCTVMCMYMYIVSIVLY